MISGIAPIRLSLPTIKTPGEIATKHLIRRWGQPLARRDERLTTRLRNSTAQRSTWGRFDIRRDSLRRVVVWQAERNHYRDFHRRKSQTTFRRSHSVDQRMLRPTCSTICTYAFRAADGLLSFHATQPSVLTVGFSGRNATFSCRIF